MMTFLYIATIWIVLFLASLFGIAWACRRAPSVGESQQ